MLYYWGFMYKKNSLLKCCLCCLLRLQDNAHRIWTLEAYAWKSSLSPNVKPYIHSVFLPKGIKQLVFVTHISQCKVIVGQTPLPKIVIVDRPCFILMGSFEGLSKSFTKIFLYQSMKNLRLLFKHMFPTFVFYGMRYPLTIIELHCTNTGL